MNDVRLYRAIGWVSGIFERTPEGFMLDIEGQRFPVRIKSQFWKFHRPGETQCFSVHPSEQQGKLTFAIVREAKEPKAEFVLNGCWQTHKGKPFLKIYRNRLVDPKDRQLSSYLYVDWENAPKADGRFWELKAELREGKLVIVEAEGPYPAPPRATKFIPNPTPDEERQPTSDSPKSDSPRTEITTTILSLEEMRKMAIPVKIQITCKLSVVPPHRVLENKQVEFFLTEGERIIFVKMSSKQFKKLTEHGFDQWVAVVSGTMGPTTEAGFELSEASVQIFEKEAKDAPSASKDEGEAKLSDKPVSSEKTTPDAQPGPGELMKPGKKNLLTGVKIG
jgi:hypothetical protein